MIGHTDTTLMILSNPTIRGTCSEEVRVYIPVPSKATSAPPKCMTREQMEEQWYKAMKLRPEVDYRRPPPPYFELAS